MKGLTYFAALMALFAAMFFAQSSTSTSTGQSNSSTSSAQSQSQTNSDTPRHASRDTNGSRMHDHHAEAVAPDTTGRAPAANEPRSTAPPVQQPNFPTRPTPQSQAYLTQTPAARAVATHTPDPGTCMNPAALQAAENGNQPRPGAPCD